MIKADIHMHTSFSGDSKAPMEDMILSSIDKGFDTICITEHMDIDYPVSEDCPEGLFLLDTDKYLERFNTLKQKYDVENGGTINLLFGVELGLQPHLASTHSDYVNHHPFDFIIGSEHTTCANDPYYPSFYEGRSEYEAYCEYFEDIVRNLNVFSNIDTLGHLDYVVRYGPNKNSDYSYKKYADYIDAILKILVAKGIGLEVNSGGYKYGLGTPNPCKDVLLRYRELGGEIITIGSDAHDPSRIGADFDKVNALLIECNFKHYCVFKNREAIYYTIE